jgi:hypothetical protein
MEAWPRKRRTDPGRGSTRPGSNRLLSSRRDERVRAPVRKASLVERRTADLGRVRAVGVDVLTSFWPAGRRTKTIFLPPGDQLGPTQTDRLRVGDKAAAAGDRDLAQNRVRPSGRSRQCHSGHGADHRISFPCGDQTPAFEVDEEFVAPCGRDLPEASMPMCRQRGSAGLSLPSRVRACRPSRRCSGDPRRSVRRRDPPRSVPASCRSRARRARPRCPRPPDLRSPCCS